MFVMTGLPPQIGDVAVVAYLPGDLASYLRALTQRLAPLSPHPSPHLTLLPPRPTESMEAMIEQLRRTAREEPPFAIRLGELATFLPISEVMYLELLHGNDEARKLHRHLSQIFPPDSTRESFQFHPHITVAYGLAAGEVTRLLPAFQADWARYRGLREANLRELTLVRQTAHRRWDDIVSFPLCGHR